MDPRRLLIPALAGLGAGGCAELAHVDLGRRTTSLEVRVAEARFVDAPSVETLPLDPHIATAPAEAKPAAAPARTFAEMAPIANPSDPGRPPRPRASGPQAAARSGPAAIAAANASARETSQARGFLGGVQVFTYEPGRVYEVWAAPLRVTTLSLSPGESVISKAAGDTVRWQIGETESGEGPNRRAHVMIKPLERGLETNLVLATSRRLYLLQLRSGGEDAFNTVVTWDAPALVADGMVAAEPAVGETALVGPQGPLDAGYRIRAKGRRPAWTPTAVMTDGARTFLTFPAAAAAAESPALFAVSPTGETQLVNYRQQGGVWVVDRVLDAAELRIGGRRKSQVVRIDRTGGRP